MARLLILIFPLVILTDCIGPLVQLGPVHAGHLKYGLLLAVVVVTLPRWRLTPPVVMILAFIVYVTGLALLSSDLGNSFNGVMRVGLAFSMYPISVSVLRSVGEVRVFLKALTLGAVITVLTFAAAQVAPWGWEGYARGEGFSYGGMGVYATYLLTYLLLAGPLSLPTLTKSRRLVMMIIYAASAAIILVSFRRSAVLGLIAGFALFMALGGVRINAKRVLASGAVLLVVAAVFFSMFGDRVGTLYEARVAGGYQTELESKYGRVAETMQVWQNFADGTPRHKLFGTEFFNSTDIFEWLRKDRPIHVDYNVILDGAGAVGLIGFLMVYLLIALRFRTSYRRLFRSRSAVGVHALFWALLVTSLIFSASNQLWVTVPYALFFALLGAMQRYAELLPTKRAIAARTQGPILRAPLPASSSTTYPQAHARTP